MIRRLGSAVAHTARQQPRPVPCCIRGALARQHAAPSRAASTSAPRSQLLKSTDMFGGKSNLNPRLKAALIAAIAPPEPQVPDPVAILQAVKGYLDAPGSEIPSLHRNGISSILSRHYCEIPATDDEVVTVADALWTICGDPKSVALTATLSKKHHMAIVARYTRWMVAEATRGDEKRVRTVLDAFERQLRSVAADDKAGEGRGVFPSQAAAWVLLRARLGITDGTDIKLRLPSLNSVLNQVAKLGRDREDEAIKASAAAIFSHGAVSILPSTAKSLEGRLAFLRGDGNIKMVVEAWKTFVEMLDKKEKHGLTADGGYAALGAFIWACSPWRNELREDRAALLPILEEAKARVPKPTPLPVFHAMLRGSRPTDSGTVTISDEVNPNATDRDFVLASAADAWASVRAEGVVPDVQAYALYLRLLGYHGEWVSMFKIWDDMIGNQETRKLWLAELKADPAKPPSEADLRAWPPTIILNQVLSSAFMIGQRPADMGMQLFEASVVPNSPLEPDVVTINTVLRWAAHLANIPMINKVIATAGKIKIKPDIVTYTTMVHGLLRAERPDLARATLDAMRSRGIEPNDVMASMLVADLASDGTAEGLRRAEYVIRDMRARGLKTTVPMWTALVGGYFGGGWDLDGWDALARMKTQGHRLNDKAWNIVLKQLTRGSKVKSEAAEQRIRRGTGEGDGKGSTAIRLFRQMVRDGVNPNEDTYAIILDPLVRAKATAEVEEILDDMESRAFDTRRPSLKRMIFRARKLVHYA